MLAALAGRIYDHAPQQNANTLGRATSMSLPERIAVTRSDLIALLNAELAKHTDCVDCRFDGPIFELRTPDEIGANWSDSLKLRCSGRAGGPCLAIAYRVAAAIRARYNIAPDPEAPVRSKAAMNALPPRYVYVGFLIDANRINARQADQGMNRLERWRKDDVIEIIMSESSYNEAGSGGDQRRARKVSGQIYSMTMATTDGEETELASIERILFPGGANNDNQRNDVDVVFNAMKYGRILVTADGGSRRQPGGILGNRDALRALGVRIMTTAEAVAHVKGKIRERDDLARAVAEQDGVALPDWVGRD